MLRPVSFGKVLKFGGAALADGPAVERACALVLRNAAIRPVVVVSAHRGVTSLLDLIAHAAAAGSVDADRVRIRHKGLLRQLALDAELLNRYFVELGSLLQEIRARGRLRPEERDLVLSYGERMSARVVAHVLKRLGLAATPVDAFDLGLTTDSNHGAARPLPGSGAAVRNALGQVPGIPVVTGFLAQDGQGNLTTLGRNGSDLTASLVAESVGAPELELWKAVGGMMTADPAIVPGARIVERLSFEEAAELAAHGADVLHPEALGPARRAGTTVRFLDVSKPDAPGTVLVAEASASGPVGLAARRRLLRLVLPDSGSSTSAGGWVAAASLLARHTVEPTAVRSVGGRVELLIAPGPATDALLAEAGRACSVEKDLALVAIVGGSRTPDQESEGSTVDREGDVIGVRALATLAELGLAVREAQFAPRRGRWVFLVGEDDLEPAVRGLHDAFFARSPARAS
jgi:aspartate kinase